MRNYNYDSWLTSFLDYDDDDDYDEDDVTDEEDLPETNKQEN
jgi:hypothetical protein